MAKQLRKGIAQLPKLTPEQRKEKFGGSYHRDCGTFLDRLVELRSISLNRAECFANEKHKQLFGTYPNAGVSPALVETRVLAFLQYQDYRRDGRPMSQRFLNNYQAAMKFRDDFKGFDAESRQQLELLTKTYNQGDSTMAKKTNSKGKKKVGRQGSIMLCGHPVTGVIRALALKGGCTAGEVANIMAAKKVAVKRSTINTQTYWGRNKIRPAAPVAASDLKELLKHRGNSTKKVKKEKPKAKAKAKKVKSTAKAKKSAKVKRVKKVSK